MLDTTPQARPGTPGTPSGTPAGSPTDAGAPPPFSLTVGLNELEPFRVDIQLAYKFYLAARAEGRMAEGERLRNRADSLMERVDKRLQDARKAHG